MGAAPPPVPRAGPVGPLWVRLRRTVARDATREILAGSALVLAPHPDDETIACGLLLAAKAAGGQHVTAVVATDGALGWFGDGPAPPPAALAAVRSAEWHAALDALGVPAGDRVELGCPDGGLADHEGTVAATIAGLVGELAPDQVFFPSPDDLHADHRALARATLRAVDSLGPGVPTPVLYAYRVYPEAGLWPGGRADGTSPAGAAVRLVRSLPGLVRRPDLALRAPGQVAAKARATAAHVSQYRLLDGPSGAVWGTGVELFSKVGPGPA